jgi:hypothetical protein
MNTLEVGALDALADRCETVGRFCTAMPTTTVTFACTAETPDCGPDGTRTTRVAEYHTPVGTLGFASSSPTGPLGNIDNDNDAFGDMDSNRDGFVDFLDDGTLGPVSDDNPLCGSGIPGDPLQEAIQYEFTAAEMEQLQAAGGIPPRSPIFCSSVSGLLGITGQTLETLSAGGNGVYGRRDFLWQAGQQAKIDFQRKNVLGFSVDFAEGRTKTSWGIEFSWTANRLFPTTLGRRGLHTSDDFALTISVDRPTFFNFLNPNRSFFVNFQFFMRYLPSYEGGAAGRDGMWGVQHGKWDGLATLFFFTGYFQDRLQPRMIVVFAPTSQSGAFLTGLSYRWNDAFSTALAWNSFFGNDVQVSQAEFPIALRSTIRTTNEAITRGLNAVRHRDVAVLTFRYTF